ncbi:unnamed protein product, partial [Tetraodon nigroviridis]
GVKNGVKAESGASDDELNSDVVSHYSSARTSASVVEEGTAGGEQVDEQTAQEETEDKLKQCIDNLMDKSAKTRLAGLESLRQAFSSRVLCDFLSERRLTISDCLERSLKKRQRGGAGGRCYRLRPAVHPAGGRRRGRGGLQDASARSHLAPHGHQRQHCSAPEREYSLDASHFRTSLSKLTSCACLHQCARALGMCCYVSAAEDGEVSTASRHAHSSGNSLDNCHCPPASSQDLVKSLALLESVFMSSYANREGALPTAKPGGPGLHGAALQAWALLVTLCPPSKLTLLLDQHLPKLQECLQSNDVNYRIAVGETIALLVELGRDVDEQFEVEDSEGLCQCLKSLATDGNKHRAKNDRRKQRSIFREVLHYIENEDFTEETIRFGVESVYIDSWVRRRIYDAFKEIMESGVRHHLQFNSLLRDIFGLGPPLILDTAVRGNKISRFEKHLFNSAAFKARTKQRSKVRDKRADVM